MPRYRHPTRPLAERFWPKVNVQGPDECWLWTAGKYLPPSFPYGRINEGGGRGRTIPAHRASWAIHYGPVPDGMCVCHRCDNPLCVNPAHLFLGTSADNNADRHAKGRTKVGRPMRGELCGMSKLTADDIAAVRRLADTLSRRELGERFGVNESTISKIVLRKRWQHLPRNPAHAERHD